MKKIEKQLLNSVKSLPMMEKEIVFSGVQITPKKTLKNFFHNTKNLVISSAICVGAAVIVGTQVIPPLLENPTNKFSDVNASSFESQEQLDDEVISKEETSNNVEGETEESESSIKNDESPRVDTTSSKEDINSKVDTSNDETTKDTSNKTESIPFGDPAPKPPIPINFVPNRILATPGSDEKVIALSNKVFYNGTRYAYTTGKNSGVDCGAIITVDADGEYVSCIAIIDTKNNERGVFSVYNNRIYYLNCAQNSWEVFELIESLQVWSMNLSGEDKRQEIAISAPFTHMSAINGIANSKYMLFPLYNGFDYTYSYYKYDVSTKEVTKINTPEFDEGFYINNNQLFGYDADNLKFYKFDANLGNKELLLDVSTITSDYILVDIVQNGFIFTAESTNSKYFLDLNGNISKK